jgi:hypothetical protein
VSVVAFFFCFASGAGFTGVVLYFKTEKGCPVELKNSPTASA